MCEDSGLQRSLHSFSERNGCVLVTWQLHLCSVPKKYEGVSFTVGSVGRRIGHGFFLTSSE